LVYAVFHFPRVGDAGERLNRLRKKAEFLAEYAKSIPQGLKAALIVLGLCPG
jgi:hypothetical protein